MLRFNPSKKQVVLPVIPPRDYQCDPWKAYRSGCKNIIISIFRRGGKDITSLSIAVDYAINNPFASVVIMCPTLAWTKRVYARSGQDIEVINPITGEVTTRKGSLLNVCIPKELMLKENATEGIYTLINGSTITLLGSNEGTFIGMRINFLVVSETASHKESIFGLISPVMEESNGISIFNGTVLREDNFFWEWIENNKNLPGWYVHYLELADVEFGYYLPPKDENGRRSLVVNTHLEGTINKYTGRPHVNLYGKVLAGNSVSMVIREYLNIPTDVEAGSFYSEILSSLRNQGNISQVHTINHDLPVHCCLDLGVRDACCIVWFQVIEDNLVFVDCYSNTREEIKHYIDVIRSKPYKQGACFAPHDAANTSLQTGMNLLEHARQEYDFIFNFIPRAKSVIADINVVRAYLRTSYFDSVMCRPLLVALEAYKANPLTGLPVHDKHSDFCDSLRYCVSAVHMKLISPNAIRLSNSSKSRQSFLPSNVDEHPSNMGRVNQRLNGNLITNVDGTTQIGASNGYKTFI